MGSPITLKSWFASIEPGAPPGDRSLAVWIFGLRGEEEEPVALQLKDRLGRHSFRTEVDGERQIVKLEGPLAQDRAKTAGVDEMYINTFRDGITEHLEFTLHAALSLPPHKVRLSVAFPRFLRSSPTKKQSSPTKPPAVPDEPLPDSLFDLGTGFQSPARARRTRKQLAEELHAARRARDPFAVLRGDASLVRSTCAGNDRDEGHVSQDEDEEVDVEETAQEEETEAAAVPETISAEVDDIVAQSTPPSEASDPRTEPAANPVHPASAPLSEAGADVPVTTSTDTAPPASTVSQPAQTPLRSRPSSKKARLASLTASFFKSRPNTPSSSSSLMASTSAAPLKPDSTRTIAAVLSTFFQQHPPPSPPGTKPPAPKSPARTPVKRVLALADSLASSSPALVSRLERAAGNAGIAILGKGDGWDNEYTAGEEALEQERAEMDVEQTVVIPLAGELAENGSANAETAQESAATLVEASAPTDTEGARVEQAVVVEIQEEKVAELMDVDGGVAPSERYSSIEPAFPSSQGGISSLLHDSADEGDADDNSADLTAQQISDFVERDLASSVIDEDEYKRESGAASPAAVEEQQKEPTPHPAPTEEIEFALAATSSLEAPPAPIADASDAPVEPEPAREESTTMSSSPPARAAAEPVAPSQHCDQSAFLVPDADFAESPSEAPTRPNDESAATSSRLPVSLAAVHAQAEDDSSAKSPELAISDAAKDSMEEAAHNLTEEVVSRAVGCAVESIAGPVVSDALAELAAQAAGEAVTGVVSTVVDAAVEAIAHTVQLDGRGTAEKEKNVDEEKAEVGRNVDDAKEQDPSSLHDVACGLQNTRDPQEPLAAVEPEPHAFVEQDFLEPEQSKDQWEGGADFAAKYWAQQMQASDFAAVDEEEKEVSLNVKEPHKKPFSEESSRSPRSPSGSILSRDAAAIASDPVARAALSALRNEQEPVESPVGPSQAERQSSDSSRESSHDVFGPVDHVQKVPSSSTPSQGSRPPRARTLSAPQQSAPAKQAQARQPGKKAQRRGSTFIGVEIIVSPRKRPARARTSAAPPAASTARAVISKAPTRSPVDSSIFDSPAAHSPPPPVHSKTWLDPPVETDRAETAGQQGIDGDSQDDFDDESDDPLAQPIPSKKRQAHSQRSKACTPTARVKATNDRASSSDSSDDETVAKRLLNGTSTTVEVDASAAAEREAEGANFGSTLLHQSGDDSSARRKKRPRDATRPPKAKRRRISPRSATPQANQQAPTSQQAPRRPSLAGKIRQPSGSQPAQAVRGTRVRVDRANAPRRKSRSSADDLTPGSAARPVRDRKPVDGWWDISRSVEAAASSTTKRGRDSMENKEADKNDEPAKQHKVVQRGRKRRAIESPELGADFNAQDLHDDREELVAREDVDYVDSRDDDFDPTDHAEVEEDDEPLASPEAAKKAPVPKTTSTNGANSGKKKRRKRKSIVMPTFVNRKRQSAAAAASASGSPAPSQTPKLNLSHAGKGKKVANEEREQGLARASSVKKARKEIANREDLHESSSGLAKPPQAKSRLAQPKKTKKTAVDVPDWAEGDEWAGLREVGIAREADEDPFHFSD
ncbi:cell wall surface anchor family protein [Rhodotorula toruloides]|uniref:Cell wall surface anchor family protein n=1 Tax=Rhodotorula toruloides TaxID=5286 RepID=A0A511KAV5_RHOTO|nr:cell wall surface anchor family protein [Rhodotorula toruloides]